jgi:hypothetical protein
VDPTDGEGVQRGRFRKVPGFLLEARDLGLLLVGELVGESLIEGPTGYGADPMTTRATDADRTRDHPILRLIGLNGEYGATIRAMTDPTVATAAAASARYAPVPWL